MISNIYSDNGSNFIGAEKEVKVLHDFVNSPINQGVITKALANDTISWHFILARSPHLGGLWEAAVKSVKHHLRRIAGNKKFTWEGLLTLTTQIEAVFNSRPLCAVSNDPDDYTIITPGHFLFGDALTTII